MNYQAAIMSQPAPAAGELPVGETPIRVMIVDDSAVVRGLASRWLDEELGIEVVARHAHGKLAVADVARSAPDLVLLDVEMPVMDGLEAQPLLLNAKPGVRVLWCPPSPSATPRSASRRARRHRLSAEARFQFRAHSVFRLPRRGGSQDQGAG